MTNQPCVCKTLKGAPCAVKNATHEVAILHRGNTAYQAEKLPPVYKSSMWLPMTVKVCGGHKQTLLAGKAITLQAAPCNCTTRKIAVLQQIQHRGGQVVACNLCGDGHRWVPPTCVHEDWSTPKWKGTWVPTRSQAIELKYKLGGWLKPCHCGKGFVVGWH